MRDFRNGKPAVFGIGHNVLGDRRFFTAIESTNYIVDVRGVNLFLYDLVGLTGI